MPAGRGKFGAYSGILSSGVAKSIVVDWAGDETDNRVIDLGDDYDLVLVFEDTDVGSASHLAMAHALQTVYGVFIHDNSTTATLHRTGSGGAAYWQGKMSGVDANKIKLGSDGSDVHGTNAFGISYRAIGLKLV
jgi:hypothetical protein